MQMHKDSAQTKHATFAEPSAKHEPMNLNLHQVLAWLQADEELQARMMGSPNRALQFDRVHTDTRTLVSGDLFVALKGEKYNANSFLEQAKHMGAKAAICEHGLQAMNWLGIEVSDTAKALGVLAASWRRDLDVQVIAVTGSNGKTTVTQMLASILRAWQGEKSLATEGNFNNAVGVPLTLLRMRNSHRCAVLELGMNHPGEIIELAQWVQPQVALVNNAQREHQEFMGSVKAVAIENAQVFKALTPEGVAVFPMDDEHSDLWTGMAGKAKVCRFGKNEKADVQLLKSEWADGAWTLDVKVAHQTFAFTLNLPGEHNVHNALASTACAYSLGVPMAMVQKGLADFQAVQGRSSFKALRVKAFNAQLGQEQEHHIGLVDDSYNANPDSVIAAIDLLARLEGPRVLVLGDMGEVGEHGVMFHEEVGRYASQVGIDHLMGLGPLTQHAVKAFEQKQSRDQRAEHFEAIEPLIKTLSEQLPEFKSLLIKGSRFMKMERVVEALLSQSMAKEDITCS